MEVLDTEREILYIQLGVLFISTGLWSCSCLSYIYTFDIRERGGEIS